MNFLSVNHPQAASSFHIAAFESNEDADIEYLAFDDFGELEEDSFNEFCESLQFDPFHPEGENELINRLIGKRKRDVVGDELNFASLPILEELQQQDHSSTTGDSNSGSPDQNTRKFFDPTTDSKGSDFQYRPGSFAASENTSFNFAVGEATSGSSKKSKSSRKEASSNTNKVQKTKIPLKDIRRSYSDVFARAFNTCDREILEHCLLKYCIPECCCVYKYVGSSSPYGVNDLQIIGTEAIGKFWEVLFLSMPDALFEIQENKLRVLQNGSCASVSKFIFHATKLFKMSTDDGHNAIVYGIPSNGSDSVIVEKKVPKSAVNINDINVETSLNDISLSNKYDVVIPEITTDSGDTIPAAPFGLRESLERPQVLIIIGTFSIFVNPEKKIYKFEFIHSIKP